MMLPIIMLKHTCCHSPEQGQADEKRLKSNHTSA
jgi:hypothetical protein